MQFVTAEAVEIITSHTFSFETADDLRLLFEPSTATPPTAAARAGGAALSALALSLAREEARIITAGAGSVDDPVVGLGNLAGIPEITSSTNVVDSIIEALASLRGDGREPIGVLVGGSTEKKLRQLKDSAGNFVFPPSAPLAIGNVPIATCYGIPSGTNTFAIVLSAGAAIPFIRPINGRPLEVRVSTQAALQTDQVIVRVRERLGVCGLPGVGLSGLRRIVGISAP
jgi:HK97 family phage major capsid protein